ncbi:unnamed protein product (macronuclear) [Paramecium tetraurelia]|uniref:Transmembrane protein n=1 Tax=Paramecium tetraurelia TaxID=5888 RepID=A0DUH0_PARTE|nr:uncharacterized protein GSPATT00020359001 [Paramecium tetraurelia]CAK86687.1 unnamed protein product [Paramecium tetraurelia]|eukprot:XP_001454084.1 hypothetical protein (macronuclear) [Paramecium tetraurelia strain d4-2]
MNYRRIDNIREIKKVGRYSLYILNLNNIKQRFPPKQISVTNPTNQINYGKILVKRSPSILYYQNFPFRSIYFSFLVIKFKQSSIQKYCRQDDKDSNSYAQKYILRFQGSQHQYILKRLILHNKRAFARNQRNYTNRYCSNHKCFIGLLSITNYFWLLQSN